MPSVTDGPLVRMRTGMCAHTNRLTQRQTAILVRTTSGPATALRASTPSRVHSVFLQSRVASIRLRTFLHHILPLCILQSGPVPALRASAPSVHAKIRFRSFLVSRSSIFLPLRFHVCSFSNRIFLCPSPSLSVSCTLRSARPPFFLNSAPSALRSIVPPGQSPLPLCALSVSSPSTSPSRSVPSAPSSSLLRFSVPSPPPVSSLLRPHPSLFILCILSPSTFRVPF